MSVGPYALVIAPTKELAHQIQTYVEKLTLSLPFLQSVNFSINEDTTGNVSRDEIDIIVSTPSRLLSVLNQNQNLLKNIQCVVLDEADLLFSYGYRDEIMFIFLDILLNLKLKIMSIQI